MKYQDVIEHECTDHILSMARCLGSHDPAQQRYDDFMECILSIDSYKVHRVCLSCGGPADYFELHVTQDGIARIFYEYQNWFDGARIELTGRAFEVVAQMFSYLGEEY